MGLTKLGTMGSISGKVGKVVGSKWKGIPYLRAIPDNVKNPQTPAQLEQRMRFKLVTDLMYSMAPLLADGFKDGVGKTPVNRAVSFNIGRIITGEYPDLEIDYSRLKISRGKLTEIYDAKVDGDVYRKAVFTWEDNSGYGDAKADDRILLLLINTDRDAPVYITEGFTRQDAEAEIDLPASFAGQAFEAFISVVRADGSKTADSLYLGSFTAAEEPQEP